MNARLFKTVKEIINDWDPVELLAIHFPDDEYHSELRVICTYIEATKELQEVGLGTCIYSTFKDFLGQEFQKTLDECMEISKKIIKSIKDNKIESDL